MLQNHIYFRFLVFILQLIFNTYICYLTFVFCQIHLVLYSLLLLFCRWSWKRTQELGAIYGNVGLSDIGMYGLGLRLRMKRELELVNQLEFSVRHTIHNKHRNIACRALAGVQSPAGSYIRLFFCGLAKPKNTVQQNQTKEKLPKYR